MNTFHDTLIQDASAIVNEQVKMFYLRRGASEFPIALADRIQKLGVREIVWATQSESDGNLTMCVFYK